MMAALQFDSRLIDRMPKVRGELTADASLDRYTWFRVGGPAEVLFKPADALDLADFIKGLPEATPMTVVGVGSNLLVRDGGVPGVVIRLGRAFGNIDVMDGAIYAGAGALDVTVAREAEATGLGGLEFLSGIPGTIGGALRMNAGAYGREVADVFMEAEVVDDRGEIRRLTAGDMGFAYRHVAVPENWIFLGAKFRAEPAERETISAKMSAIRQAREDSQPMRTRTGGSTFANPEGQKAWQLIDAAGCRGLMRGGAMVSEKHCNFLINQGDATAADLEGLGEEVRRRVMETAGVELRWEIRRIGVAKDNPLAAVETEGEA